MARAASRASASFPRYWVCRSHKVAFAIILYGYSFNCQTMDTEADNVKHVAMPADGVFRRDADHDRKPAARAG
jgi:hypothetical protein